MRLAVLALSFCSWSEAWSQQESRLRCIHSRGDRLFNGAQDVTVSRQGEAVTVRPANAGSSDENWSYRIVFEEPSVAFRSIRVLGTEGKTSPLNAVLGGELFYIVDSNVQRIEVTAVNAANAQSSKASLVCRNAS